MVSAGKSLRLVRRCLLLSFVSISASTFEQTSERPLSEVQVKHFFGGPTFLTIPSGSGVRDVAKEEKEAFVLRELSEWLTKEVLSAHKLRTPDHVYQAHLEEIEVATPDTAYTDSPTKKPESEYISRLFEDFNTSERIEFIGNRSRLLRSLAASFATEKFFYLYQKERWARRLLSKSLVADDYLQWAKNCIESIDTVLWKQAEKLVGSPEFGAFVMLQLGFGLGFRQSPVEWLKFLLSSLSKIPGVRPLLAPFENLTRTAAVDSPKAKKKKPFFGFGWALTLGFEGGLSLQRDNDESTAHNASASSDSESESESDNSSLRYKGRIQILREKLIGTHTLMANAGSIIGIGVYLRSEGPTPAGAPRANIKIESEGGTTYYPPVAGMARTGKEWAAGIPFALPLFAIVPTPFDGALSSTALSKGVSLAVGGGSWGKRNPAATKPERPPVITQLGIGAHATRMAMSAKANASAACRIFP
ncbi:MAG: hypothetical protein COT74_08505 [Bdellovibrionales bacterium CG10_big_fil_rev_8_21_14_0_10_45_34]|nr:MAG: hypothetical protein COT74_08505 [Bdellovibrionales bacterium CG10_big_fil_rev_8_21_14_0_10_45_34]